MSISGTAAEAEDLVRRAWSGRARLEAVEPLAGDASSRSYERLRLGGEAPPTAVLMRQSGSGLSISSDELSQLDEPPPEMPFLNVRRYLESVGIAVPALYAADPERGLVLLEDVGDLPLFAAARRAPDPGALYGDAVRTIVELQLAGRESPDPSCVAFSQRFDRRLFLWEFDHFLEYGFTGRRVADEDRAACRRHFERLAAQLAAAPAWLAHRDFHGWNLFVLEGRIRVIDFQDALFAPATYDLASLLTDRTTPDLVDRDLESELLELYRGLAAERLRERASAAEIEGLYRRTVLHRALKVVGRFHYLEDVKGKRGYRDMIPAALATVRRALEGLPDEAPLRALLARSFPELA